MATRKKAKPKPKTKVKKKAVAKKPVAKKKPKSKPAPTRTAPPKKKARPVFEEAATQKVPVAEVLGEIEEQLALDLLIEH
ncbi:MAG: hypothetical protein JNM69_35960 [Archangium sp.]|nr:hypothetical protein [Archangium sp.]